WNNSTRKASFLDDRLVRPDGGKGSTRGK
ncbi:MAG: hypothetical protein RJA59_2306, partial [Pseudomonadota bacterium]